MSPSRRVLVLALAVAVAGAGAALSLAREARRPLPPLTPAEAGLARVLRDDVETLALGLGERNRMHAKSLAQAADWLAEGFGHDGYRVERQPFATQGLTQTNVIASGPETPGQEIVVVGAHYDTVIGSPGANDNGSGVAAMRAIAHALAHRHFPRALRFVGFSNEEYGFQTDEMGSRQYARRCRARGEHVVAMLSLETMGYYSEAAGSQHYPLPALGWLYPDRGDFVGIVGDPPSYALARGIARDLRARTAFPAQWAALPDNVPGAGWSDHWAFWQEGFPAVMVTDTAPFRYAYYHTPQDTPDKLDYPAFARVVAALVDVVADLAARTQGS